MSSTRSILCRMAVAGVAAVPLLVLTAPAASPAPPYDSQGYLNSTARCTAPDSAVVFGSTASSRIAICSDGEGNYEYRGVRVRDGARLIVPASKSSDGAFTASNDGIDYMVTSEALVVSVDEKVLRDEPMTDFHSADTAGMPAQAPIETDETTPTTALPPPLPAEVGADEG